MLTESIPKHSFLCPLVFPSGGVLTAISLLLKVVQCRTGIVTFYLLVVGEPRMFFKVLGQSAGRGTEG